MKLLFDENISYRILKLLEGHFSKVESVFNLAGISNALDIWSNAKENGLVDELGSLDDAIAAAAEMAELDEYGIRKYPKYKSDFERLLEDFGGAKSKFSVALIQEEIGLEAYQILKEFKQITQQKGIQAKMPFSLNIK